MFKNKLTLMCAVYFVIHVIVYFVTLGLFSGMIYNPTAPMFWVLLFHNLTTVFFLSCLSVPCYTVYSLVMTVKWYRARFAF